VAFAVRTDEAVDFLRFEARESETDDAGTESDDSELAAVGAAWCAAWTTPVMTACAVAAAVLIAQR
jgi:hypothetical protein